MSDHDPATRTGRIVVHLVPGPWAENAPWTQPGSFFRERLHTSPGLSSRALPAVDVPCLLRGLVDGRDDRREGPPRRQRSEGGTPLPSGSHRVRRVPGMGFAVG